jgi:NTE family protein
VSIGIVLGAGGVTGGAYIAGALAALENDLGFDARTADVIVGTSAGSLVGALLRSGIPASDIAAWTIGARLSEDARVVLGEVERPSFDPVDLRRLLRPPRVPHPRSMWTALRHPVRFDPMRALLTHLADGTRVLLPQVSFLGDAWPAQAFYCCAVRRSIGTRVVFGRDDVDAPLAAAVAASCAVPGYFAPVVVDGHRYLDGGVKSSTNADLLRDAGLDLVIVVAPMCPVNAQGSRSIEQFLRGKAARQLRGEIAALERDGGPTVVSFGPDEQTLAHMSSDFMSDTAVPEIVLSAFLETGAQLRATPLAEQFSRGRAA